eukprot:gene1712-481_t
MLLWVIVGALIAVYLTSFLYFNGKTNKKGEPVYFRGIIPFLGVALDVARVGFYPYIKEISEKYGSIFTIYLFGNRIHIITDVDAFSVIQRKPKSFSFTPVMHEMSQRIKGETVDKSSLDVTKLRGAAMAVSKYLQGEPLENLTKVYGRLTLEKVNKYFDKYNTNGELVVDLQKFVRTVLFYSSSKSILGEDFDSDATEVDFFKFDDSLKLIANGFPRFLVSDAFAARERVKERILKSDLSKACEFVSKQTDGKTKSEIAEIGYGMLGASQTNTINASFWTFYDIMKDPQTKKKIIEEISDKFSIEHYEKSIDSMEILQGAYLESNRFHNAGISLRQVVDDTTIEVNSKNYKLRKGDRMFMMPTAYQNPEFFENPKMYNPERFKGKIPERVKKSQIPYGGGIHLCPGRHFATNEIKLFAIIMLKHFDCEFVEEKDVENNWQNVSYLAPNGNIKIKITRKN